MSEDVKICCDVMRNAIIEQAISLHEGKPEVVGSGTEETNEHFPLRFCPFCARSLNRKEAVK